LLPWILPAAGLPRLRLTCRRLPGTLCGYTQLMDEIIFVVEEAPEGGYTAKALGASIFTEAESLDELHANVRDAVQCHFERDKVPKMIRLHYVRDEVIAL
jgi:hypothetical protein